MSDQAARLKIRDESGICVVEFADRKILEEICIAEIEEELFRVVEAGKAKRMLVSFRNVGHFSSAGLGMLLKLKRKLDENQGELRLSDIEPQIYEVFKITQLNKKFEIHPSAIEAKASFS